VAEAIGGWYGGGGETLTQFINYMIVEDLEIVSLGLKISLEEFDGLNLVGMAQDGEEAVAMALSLKPDLIIMDLGLPKLDGTEATRRICQALPDTKILVMSSREGPRDIFSCFAAGASGYCRKDTSAGEVYRSMQALMQGEVTIEAAIAGRILDSWRELQSGPPLVDHDGNAFVFSPAELKLLAVMSEGLNNTDIGNRLNLDAQELNRQKQALKQSLAALGSIIGQPEQNE